MVDAAECECVVLKVPAPDCHRLKHRAGLATSHLADDQPRQVLPQGLRDEVGDAELAPAAGHSAVSPIPTFACSASMLRRSGLQVREQLVVGLQRAEPLRRPEWRRSGRAAGSSCRRPDRRRSRWTYARAPRRAAVARPRRHHSAVDQLGQRDVGQDVLPDRDRRTEATGRTRWRAAGSGRPGPGSWWDARRRRDGPD